ncbi:MAG: tetratricopeptide repeat protein [Candidatus Electronema sp. VV]
MNNTFDSKGGEQNTAQGDHATGRLERLNNKLHWLWKHPEVTWSGTGVYVVSLVVASGVAAASWCFWPKESSQPPQANTISVTGNNSGTVVIAGGNVAVTNGMSSEEAAKLARELLGPQLSAKDEQIKALTEAITALAKADAPAKSINEALQELGKGNRWQAQAIFAEVLRSKEAEGRKANKEAAAAARHLGALAYMNDTKAALAAYQKAVQLDPDNADGWIWLGNLLERTEELAQAEEAFRKALALSKAHQEQAWAYGGLGIVYLKHGELDKAEEMHRKSLALHEALGSMEKMAGNYGNLGSVYLKRGELDKAEAAWNNSLSLFQKMGDHPNAKTVQGVLDELAQHRASQPAPPAANPRR